MTGPPANTSPDLTCPVIFPATLDRGAADGGERLPRQPHARSDGGPAGDAGEEDGPERRVQRQLDRSHRQPSER